MSSPYPKIIGICGQPLHGKSTVQGFLSNLGVTALDDAEPLRRAACDIWNLSWDDVTTQEGKRREIHAFGQRMTIRQALGDLGQVFERLFGPNFWIDRAIEQLAANRVIAPVSFGSIRRTQGQAILKAGGIVVCVRNPNIPDSPHGFDQFDSSLVTHFISNVGDLEELRHQTMMVTASYLRSAS